MKSLLTMAWRNIWRNKRRTYITVASILLAVFLASSMHAIQKGVWDNMVDNVVNYYFGYAQIHQQGYWDDQTIDKSFEFQPSLQELEQQVPAIKNLVPRLESFALASHGQHTKGVLLIGIRPAVETAMTGLQERLVAGEYLAHDDHALLLAQGIARQLKLEVGDTLVLISQGYRGQNAAGKYPIKGVIKFGSPELNKQMVYLPLKVAQQFYGAENLITSLAIQLPDRADTQPTVRAIKASLDEQVYEVLDWQQMIPDLVQAKALDDAGANITLGILYLIIAFGLFGTILMMTKERMYEFGVLISIGMSRWKLGISMFIETLLLSLLGAALGILLSIPLIGYFHRKPVQLTGELAAAYEKFGVEPILPAAFEPSVFLTQAAVVFFMATVLVIYPLWTIWRLKPVEAMRV